MSLTRKFLSAMGIESDQVDEIIKAHTETVNGIKKELDEYKDNADNIDTLKSENKRLSEELKQIKDDAYVILLDLQGKEIDSVQFSKLIQDINTYHASNITFVIGGSLGVSEQVRKRADYRLKISDMTFPHNLARLIILEQIYRAYKIANNETYHK